MSGTVGKQTTIRRHKMVRVSGVPYDVDLDLPKKDDEPQLGLEARAYFDGVRFGIGAAIAYLEFMHETHKELHNYYKFAAVQLKEKIR
jgi:hypothetical protein